MIDPAIGAFFEERKESWLKKNISASMTDVEVKEKEQECEVVFALKNWLPDAAKRAKQISISTHPCTFSHPSARKNKNGYVSSLIAKSAPKNDGFLRSGNVDVAADALGNAAALDVYKFLMLVMEDGKSLLAHFEQGSDLVQILVLAATVEPTVSYHILKEGFLAMTAPSDEVVTSSKIKQVYFPLAEEGEYHQLSVLTASGIVFDLRKRLDNMRFGDDIKLARQKRKDNEEHANFREIYNLATIGYGGTKPQNISVLNNQNGGKAHLFLSVPPAIKNRDVHFPQADFFAQSVNYFQCRTQFLALHTLYKLPNEKYNNMHTRAARDALYQSIIDFIIERSWQVRSVSVEQYKDLTNQLSSAQKTWLCEDKQALRDTTDDWLDEITHSITNFIFHGYEKVLAKKAIKLGDAEKRHITEEVEKSKEALR